jgi:hypothetical protein
VNDDGSSRLAASVHLITDEIDDPITLHLQATARVRDSFYCQHRAVLLKPGHLTTVVARLN